MRQKVEACPYEPTTRAWRCEGCCAKSGGMTPCVAAWLASKAGYVDLVEPAPPISPVALKRELRRAA